jgi:hypothetical protein
MLKILEVFQVLIGKTLTPFIPSYLPQMSLLVGLPESSGGLARSYPQDIIIIAVHVHISPGDEQ